MITTYQFSKSFMTQADSDSQCNGNKTKLWLKYILDKEPFVWTDFVISFFLQRE